jgi:hypothetical protein
MTTEFARQVLRGRAGLIEALAEPWHGGLMPPS